RLDVAARAQAEDGAAIIQKIEFGVAPAPDELFLPLGLAPGQHDVAPHDLRINGEEGEPDFAGESKIGFPVARVQPVIEDAADAAHLVAVLEEKVIIAPLPVFL